MAAVTDYTGLALEFGSFEGKSLGTPDYIATSGSYKAAYWRSTDELSYMQVSHYDVDRRLIISELFIATVVTDDVVRIFEKIFISKCAVEVHSLPEEKSSIHALGRAINVKPIVDAEAATVVRAFYDHCWSWSDAGSYFFKPGITN